VRLNGIADYELLEPLGRGSQGHCFLARPPARLGLDDERCVVKVLERHATDLDFRRVVRELRVFSAVRSDHLSKLFEAGYEAGAVYVSLRHYSEGSLGRDDPGLEPARRVTALADAARGAHALHEVGVVHRAVKPSNVLIENGRGRLADLGLPELITPGLTSTGLGSIGTVEFMEPDLVWGERPSRACDIWSLGVSLHRAVAGASMYGDIPRDRPAAALQHILHTRPIVDPSTPGPCREVILRCVAEKRTERYATALDLAIALEKVAATPDLAALRPGRPDSGSAPVDNRAETRDFQSVLLLGVDPPPALTGRRPLPIEGRVEVADDAGTGPGGDEVTVEGVRCARNHHNDPQALYCSRCGIKMLQGSRHLVEGVRPSLGVLTLDDGSTYPVRQDLVVGREPNADELVARGRALGVTVADDHRTVSRSHALIKLIGWHAFLEDRDSANGTFVRSSSTQPWRRLPAGDRVALAPGMTVRLGERELVFEPHDIA
jgi:hypothetical protein